jgi:hypothetical protein
MSIPLDRLYHYIEHIAEENYGEAVIIYRFYPHGSKKFEDLNVLKNYDWQERTCQPSIYCYDQEPLNFELYENYEFDWTDELTNIFKSLNIRYNQHNLRHTPCIYDKVFLLHSEKRSKNLDRYQENNFIPIYYWNHALLSLDWFRFAQHVSIKKISTKKFLIYNRAWTGTREYRLKFADLLVEHNLVAECQTSVGFNDQGMYYKDYTFSKTAWQPRHHLETHFPVNTTASTSSADFTIEDYENTDIEIVLETLFDDDRLHLTEKILRPIACGQPFILAATHGSLEYIRNYGFKTFDSVFDESYDTLTDPETRLQSIILLMKRISNWTDNERKDKLSQLQQIADYNRRYFFSKDFFDQITSELETNLLSAFEKFEQSKSCNQWVSHWDKLTSYQLIKEFLKTNTDLVYPTDTQFKIVYKKAKKYAKY